MNYIYRKRYNICINYVKGVYVVKIEMDNW